MEMELYEGFIYLLVAGLFICNLPTKGVNKTLGCDKEE